MSPYDGREAFYTPDVQAAALAMSPDGARGAFSQSDLHLVVKRLEADLRSSRRETAEANCVLETFQTSAPVGFAFIDRDFRIVRINETLAAISGAPISQQIGRTMAEVVPHAWPYLEDVCRHVLATREPVVNQEASGERKIEGGRLHHWLASYYPIFLDRDVIGIGIVAVDITERKEADLTRSQLFHHLVAAIAATSEARDASTAGHQRRVAQISVAIATEIGLDADTIEGIQIAAELHDIGKISIPVEILTRPAKLRAAEFELVKNHSRAGYDIVCNIPFPWPVADMILQHHERFDGSGYPDGIRGDRILIGARIIAVADVVEAMSSHRPYRPAKGIQVALEEIERGRGTLYDPDVADACLRLQRQGRLQIDEPG